MTKQFAVNKNLLPPKKLLGNRSESFIIQRQKALEIYLQTLVHMFSLLPEPLALFLDLQKYVSFSLLYFFNDTITQSVIQKFNVTFKSVCSNSIKS